MMMQLLTMTKPLQQVWKKMWTEKTWPASLENPLKLKISKTILKMINHERDPMKKMFFWRMFLQP